MSKSRETTTECPNCGHSQQDSVERCALCGADLEAPNGHTLGKGDGSNVRDSLKTQWVAAVIAFWISAAVLVAVFVLQSRINLILVSITLGLMILGIGLKIRYQLHLRKGRRRH